jgi:hypothetical protein
VFEVEPAPAVAATTKGRGRGKANVNVNASCVKTTFANFSLHNNKIPVLLQKSRKHP